MSTLWGIGVVGSGVYIFWKVMAENGLQIVAKPLTTLIKLALGVDE